MMPISIEYGVFFGVVFFVSWALYRFKVARVLFLLAASYYFYASWNPSCLLLILFSSSLDFIVAKKMAKQQVQKHRKRLVWLSIGVNLGILAVLKYFNFFSDSVGSILQLCGIMAKPLYLDILLPVGISFYIFQTMSYIIDVYNRRVPPETSYFKYLLFTSFFPQLLAGPITRAKALLPQLDRSPSLSSEQASQGLYMIMIGIIKKTAIADFLAANLVDRVFDFPERFSSLEVLLAIYAYALQIYCDFSGYSDMAIGAAKLLGFDLAKNFDAPYRASRPREFWNRWHISLSTWLRDYLYIPLGGSRGSKLCTYRNLMITMLLGGLWHGALWTFVAWGALHGLALVLDRILLADREQKGAWRTLGIVCTFHFVCLTWVFFKAESFSQAWAVLAQLAAATTSLVNVPMGVWLALLVGYGSHYLPRPWELKAVLTYQRLAAPLQAAIFSAILLGIPLLFSQQASPFIYAQF